MLPRLRGAIPPGLSPPLCLPAGSRRSPRSPRLGRTARHRRSARTARRERLPRAARAIGESNLGAVNPHWGVKRGGCSTPGTSRGHQPPRCCPSTLGSPCPGAGWGCAGPASPHQEPLVQALQKGRGNIGGWVDAAGSGSLKINLFFPSFRANPESKEHPAPQATEAPPAPWVPPVSQVLLASLGAR